MTTTLCSSNILRFKAELFCSSCYIFELKKYHGHAHFKSVLNPNIMVCSVCKTDTSKTPSKGFRNFLMNEFISSAVQDLHKPNLLLEVGHLDTSRQVFAISI